MWGRFGEAVAALTWRILKHGCDVADLAGYMCAGHLIEQAK